MSLSRLLTIGLAAITGATAQTVLDDAKKIEDAQKFFDTLKGQPVRCEVLHGPPRFDFSLRLRSGYYWNLHLSEHQVAGEKWIVLTKVTPKQASLTPIYLSEVVQFPAEGDILPESKAGHFWVGEGRYGIQFLMFDDTGAFCRQAWQIDARLNATERKIAPLAPNKVAGSLWKGRVDPAGKPIFGRLTILMNVSDTSRSQEQVSLLNELTALIDTLPAGSLRLVLFDLTQQKEIFRRDGFTAVAMPEVTQAVSAVQFEPVSVSALGNAAASAGLVENLADLEIRSAQPSDAVIFIGLPSIYHVKPSADFGQAVAAKPQFFYLLLPASGAPRVSGSGSMVDYWPGFPIPGVPPVIDGSGSGRGRPSSVSYPSARGKARINGADSIGFVVAQLGGKTLKIDSPDSFAKAVAEIARLAGASR